MCDTSMSVRLAKPLDEAGSEDNIPSPNDVVISGISGRLPESDSMEEFKNNLMNGVDMVTDDGRRWEPGIHGLPTRSGKLKDLSKFDASFFGVHPKQANVMDPQLRILLEVTYEALVDAGLNPKDVRGSRTGVYIGCTSSESHEAWGKDPEKIGSYEMTGCSRSMFANRLSYFFDFKGPSYAIDSACSSSLLALDIALHAVRSGQCDAAVVGGSNLCLKPQTALQFSKLGVLSPDGACKSFDASGNGYCRSEAVIAVYIQKCAAAKRIYATLVHSKNSSDGHKEQGITFPSSAIQQQLITELYTEAGVDPANVTYVEAHGTGTKAGDLPELNSITEVFCAEGRKDPLLIGSTKSNMGHPEPASGLAGLTKVLIAMESGKLPANLHYHSPNPDIPGLSDGRLSVVSTCTPWEGGYVGINSFGFGGSNVHVLVKSYKKKGMTHIAADRQRLVTFSGRTQEGVGEVLQKLRKDSFNVQLQSLLQHTCARVHPYRGYTITNNDNTVHEIQKYSDDKRPVWYVFSGMGSQWHGMGRALMSLTVFRQSIMASDAVLQPHGINLYKMLMYGDKTIFENTINSYVGIAAIQVALVDVLTLIGISPDGIVGHSVGELGCAYADGGLTASQTVLAAYWRGRCVKEAKLPPGSMAAVGLTWEEAKLRCPEGVVPACHNSSDTVTISGPAEAVAKFVEKLKQEGIFATEVKSGGVAFHSYYMNKTAPAMKEALLKVIQCPKQRSAKWISSSIPADRWGNPLAETCSADYHVNNLISPVLFHEALQHIPKNAITIEIAPHCLLQSILKRSLGDGCSFVGLMKRNHVDNMEFLLTSLGKLYTYGVNLDSLALYPKVTYPVSTGTPMAGPYVHWDHSISWDVPTADQFGTSASGHSASCVYDIDAGPESKDHYLVGHKIDGRVLYPATGYLVLAWRTLARLHGKLYDTLAVQFEDVHIHRATILPVVGSIRLDVDINPGSGNFEITENGAIVASGKANVLDDVPHSVFLCENQGEIADVYIPLTRTDAYKELRLRGYDYGPTFQGILSTNNTGDQGSLEWNTNWVTFLDTMIQTQVLSVQNRSLRLPTRIKCIRISPESHELNIEAFDTERKGIKVKVNHTYDTCVSGGVEIKGLHLTAAPRKQQHIPPSLEEYKYIPFNESVQDTEAMHYSTLCCNYARQCINKMRPVYQNNINSNGSMGDGIHNEVPYEYANGDDSGPLKLLDKMCSLDFTGDYLKSMRNLINSHRNEVFRDRLLHKSPNHRLLKPCLDIVWENIGNVSEIKVFEIGTEKGQMCHDVYQLLNTQPLLNIDYTVICGTNETDTNVLNDFDAKTVQWDLKGDIPGSLSGGCHLVILGDKIDANIKTMELILKLAKENGFVLVAESRHDSQLYVLLQELSTFIQNKKIIPDENKQSWNTAVSNSGLEIVSQKTDDISNTLYLYKLCKDETRAVNQTVIDVSDLNFGWLEMLKGAISQEKPVGHNIWLEVRGMAANGIIGMVNCLKQEPGGDRIRCIFNADPSNTHLPEGYFEEIIKKDLVINVFRDGQWGTFRHIPLNKETYSTYTDHAYVDILTRGDLSSLRWVESPLKYYNPEFHPNKQLCKVCFASVNFRDVMLATGKLPPDAIPGGVAGQDCVLGMEFSGYDACGNRIMGFLPSKGLATTVDADNNFIWKIPNTWSLEEAASVPVVYATVYYALVVRGRIRRGDHVLIHSGSGGVGQAAISVALHHGCTIFTTVGSEKKKEYLKQRFPQLTDVNFANSRDTSFECHVLKHTQGRGVDAVLNSLSGEKLQASIRLLSPHGRFLEIGKYDLSENTSLGMSIFLRNITFHGILLDALFEDDNPEWELVASLLARGIDCGAVRPLNTTVFDKDEIEAAFRFMAQGKHIGKVLVKVRDEQEPDHPLRIHAIPRTACYFSKIYILIGGLGGVGLELAHWLVGRGARNLLLTSRSGVKNGYQSRCLRVWKEAGINVRVSTRDVVIQGQTDELFKEAIEIGPIGGIFNLALVLKDGFMENQTQENFKKVADPKVIGTINLDQASRNLCNDSLDWFVTFSSVSCGRGNAGQANYAFANSFMERVCEERQRDGLHGLAVQWGAIGDVGVILSSMGDNDTVVGGTVPQRIHSCLDTFDIFLNQGSPVLSSFVLADKDSNVKDQGSKGSLLASIANILGVKDMSVINPNTTLAALGLDSLMGVEVKQTLERDYNLVLPMKDIRLLNVNKLRAMDCSDKDENNI